jgi:hypothetical protein
MKSRLEDKQKAIKLRKDGFSYKEIMSQIEVGKGTLSGWMRNLELNTEQIKKIYQNSESKKEKGRMKASLTNRTKKLQRINIAKEDAHKSFEIHKRDIFFIAGLCLYWAEGSKRNSCYSFINSDPDMVRFMVFWTQKYLNVDKNLFKIRLFIHLPYKEEQLEKYWGRVLKINENHFQKTIYKPTTHLIKKNPSYKGCLRFYINGVSYLRKVIAWQDLLVNYLKV